MLHVLPWFSFAILFFIHFDVQTLKHLNTVISKSLCVSIVFLCSIFHQ